MVSVGATYGTATPHESNAVIVEETVGLFDFLTAGDVLTQISELKIESNISMSDAKKIALGEDKDMRHDVLATLDVIGSTNGKLKRMLHPIMPGTKLEIATSKMIAAFLGFEITEDMILVGELLRRSDVPVVLKQKWFNKHISIMGMTGAGKSNLAKVILTSLKSWFGETVLIIDPHGEYKGDNIYVDNIHGDPTVVDTDLVIERVYQVMGKVDKDFQEIIEVAKTSSTIRKKDLTNLEAIVEACDDFYMRGASRFKPHLLKAIKIETIIHKITKRIIAHKGPVPLVINLKGLKYEQAEAIVEMIADLVLELGKSGKSMVTFIDEVHNYCPQKKKALSKDSIITLISEGRKFGCGVVIMSQRPAKVDKDIISQCNTKFCLQVTNANDIRQIKSSTEYATTDMFKEVQKLVPGEALLSSPWINRPVFVKILEYKDDGTEA